MEWLISRVGSNTSHLPLETGPVLFDELRQAATSRNYAAISDLLTVLVMVIENHALLDAPDDEALSTLVKPEWIEAYPSNLVLVSNGLAFRKIEWESTGSLTLGMLFWRCIEEISSLGTLLPDLTRSSLVGLFAQSGYTYTSEIIDSCDQWLREIKEQMRRCDGALVARESSTTGTNIIDKVESDPAQNVSSAKSPLQLLVDRADSMALGGDYAGAVNEISAGPAALAFLPGTQLRLAEWNLALGNNADAIRAALRELATRPDSQRALQIVLHDQDTLMQVLSASPPSTVHLVQQIITSYSQRGS